MLVFTISNRFREEAYMATKKKAAKKAGAKAGSVLAWNPRWIKDPPPPFFKNLNQVAIRQIAAAKTNFANQVKTILKQGQK